MSIFDHFQHIQLTGDQRNAVERFNEFLHSDEKVFLLKGYAGTGKTTLSKGLCSYLNELKLSFQLMAPTGRAAMVMKEKTGQMTSTIHKAIYNMDKLVEKDEGSSFQLCYKLNQNTSSQKTVYLVDEASMISDKYSEDEFFVFGSGHLLSDLMEYTFEASDNRKLIFIGDGAQLPPVGMNDSPALNADYIYECFGIFANEYELTEVVRQVADSPILWAASELRKALQRKEFNRFVVKSDEKNVLEINTENFLDCYSKNVAEEGVDQTIVITHSNEQALNYNLRIRTLRYKKEPALLERSDKMLVAKNNYNTPVELFNGMYCRIEEVGEIEYSPKVRFYIKGKKLIEEDLIFRDVKISVINDQGFRQLLHVKVLDNFIQAKEGKINPYLQRAVYIDFKNRMSELKIHKGSEEFSKRMKTDLYFNALFLKYGYAITCHKAQGGEWKNVFIDFNVFMGKSSMSFFRWAYTAITRSSLRLMTLGAPSFNPLTSFEISPIKRLATIPQDAFFTPMKDGKPMYFIEYRLERLNKLFLQYGLTFTASEMQNQLCLQVSNQNNEQAEFILWYGNKGFTKTSWKKVSSDDFKDTLTGILEESLLPEQIPFGSRFDFQNDLHRYIISTLQESDLSLTNFIQREWCDVYYVKTTNAIAVLEFYFDKKHLYSSLIPSSTSIEKDEQLEEFIYKLQIR